MNNYNRQLINDDESFKIKNVIIILLIIMIVLVSFYFITKYVLEHKKDDTPVAESVIDREKIIFGQMFNRPDSEYYVIAYDSTGKSKDIYNKYIDNLKVSGDTLFKIKDKNIEMYKEGSNDISSYLKEISA